MITSPKSWPKPPPPPCGSVVQVMLTSAVAGRAPSPSAVAVDGLAANTMRRVLQVSPTGAVPQQATVAPAGTTPLPVNVVLDQAFQRTYSNAERERSETPLRQQQQPAAITTVPALQPCLGVGRAKSVPRIATGSLHAQHGLEALREDSKVPQRQASPAMAVKPEQTVERISVVTMQVAGNSIAASSVGATTADTEDSPHASGRSGAASGGERSGDAASFGDGRTSIGALITAVPEQDWDDGSVAPDPLGGTLAGVEVSVVPRRRLYRVSFSFTGMKDDLSQLSLAIGDVVRVQCRDRSGWTYGALERLAGGQNSHLGASGWFPDAVLGEETTVPEGEEDAAESKALSTSYTGMTDALLLESLEKLRSSLTEPEKDACFSREGVPGSTRATSSSLQGAGETVGLLAGQEEMLELNRHERRLSDCARSRQRCLRAKQLAQKGILEATAQLETAERQLRAIEEQERNCSRVQSCVSASGSQSLRRNSEAKIRMLEHKKEVALRNVSAAQERLDAQRHAAHVARKELQAEQDAVLSAMEAVSRQRVGSAVSSSRLSSRRDSAGAPPPQSIGALGAACSLAWGTSSASSMAPSSMPGLATEARAKRRAGSTSRRCASPEDSPLGAASQADSSARCSSARSVSPSVRSAQGSGRGSAAAAFGSSTTTARSTPLRGRTAAAPPPQVRGGAHTASTAAGVAFAAGYQQALRDHGPNAAVRRSSSRSRSTSAEPAAQDLPKGSIVGGAAADQRSRSGSQPRQASLRRAAATPAVADRLPTSCRPGSRARPRLQQATLPGTLSSLKAPSRLCSSVGSTATAVTSPPTPPVEAVPRSVIGPPPARPPIMSCPDLSAAADPSLGVDGLEPDALKNLFATAQSLQAQLSAVPDDVRKDLVAKCTAGLLGRWDFRSPQQPLPAEASASNAVVAEEEVAEGQPPEVALVVAAEAWQEAESQEGLLLGEGAGSCQLYTAALPCGDVIHGDDARGGPLLSDDSLLRHICQS
eukprot:TRINITY_DN114258_c0_g1_i1.p1 TRINITY_DN114258_c0_g1~~TRINITY_DN114258_c0_g1_i1.p1  ORF type:complete len:995 (+),score=209.39 TRINITY_DN114258_c0_g1_i1:89-3073(+)